MGASEIAIEGVSAARKVLGTLCAAAVFAVLVAGCATIGDTFNVTPFLREQITGDTWRACLAREYQVQTRLVLSEGRHWGVASRFSDKGWSALRGEAVAPWAVGSFDLGAERQAQLEKGRAELDAALANRGARPCPCAKAQGAYDGWLAAAARTDGSEAAIRAYFASALALCGSAQAARVEAP
jgi:hypothetical protein